MTATQPVPVSEGAPLRFMYSVAWTPTTTPFAARFKRYLDVNFFEHQIHWLSIFNSFMMVLFLTGIVAVILLRTLRKDYARYATAGEPDDLEALEMNLSDESGWKLVHGDVFRPPSHILALAALVGTGAQLAVLVVVTILITIAGAPRRCAAPPRRCAAVRAPRCICCAVTKPRRCAAMPLCGHTAVRTLQCTR